MGVVDREVIRQPLAFGDPEHLRAGTADHAARARGQVQDVGSLGTIETGHVVPAAPQEGRHRAADRAQVPGDQDALPRRLVQWSQPPARSRGVSLRLAYDGLA